MAERAGWRRLRFVDTLGVLDPFATRDIFVRLRQSTNMELEIHAHNDLGLATANSLAAIGGGATHVSTTVNGLGERAGNAALEEVVIALGHLGGRETGIRAEMLKKLSTLVAKASGRAIASNKPVVGDAIFMHESGIHVSGLLRDPKNYQFLDPAEFGRSHQIVLGKHTGTEGVRWTYGELGIQLDHVHAQAIVGLIRQYFVSHKLPPSREDLIGFYRSMREHRVLTLPDVGCSSRADFLTNCTAT